MKTATHNGKICDKHPELLGKRYVSCGKCVQCSIVKSRKRYLEHRDKCLAQMVVYAEANREKILAYGAAWRKANPDNHKIRYASNRDVECRRAKEWSKSNAERVTANRKARYLRTPEKILAANRDRQIRKLNAIPAWANKFFIEEAYHLAKLREKVCGGKWHVDHIVPLKSKLVCGLHVEYNLQVIPGVDNIKKGNRYWPDMPV